jgi:RNA polymerase sigma factor (TIGR02999 family)
MQDNGVYWTDPIRAASGLGHIMVKPFHLTDDSPSDQALLDLVYNELHRLASTFLRQERPGHTLQTSALVNEAYMRLRNASPMHFEDRQHFVRIASRAMRRVLVDYARRRRRLKREAGERIELDRVAVIGQPHLEEYLTIDTALQRLAEVDARQAEIVELRFFGGLSVPETAQTLEISEKTVKREWAVARAWLRGELDQAALA